MTAKPYDVTVNHPTSEWEHVTGTGARTTLRVEHRTTMLTTTTRPAEDMSADAPPPPKRRHPYPNCYVLNIHEQDDAATEAQAVLTYDEAKALHTMLGDALDWDGQ